MRITTKYFMLNSVNEMGTSFEYPIFFDIFATQEVQRNKTFK